MAYFKHKHNIQVRYPELPCLQLGNPGNCIPLEFVSVMGGWGISTDGMGSGEQQESKGVSYG